MSSGYARTTVLVAAVILGLATSALIYLYFSRSSKRAQQVVPVLVAATYIAADTVISPDMVKIASLPASQIELDAARSVSRIQGLVTQTPFNEGEQIVLSRLTDKSTAYGLTGIIPPGTRAMSIMVDSADAVSGFVRPGNRVDIVASFAQGSDSVARTILQDIPLLAVNGSLSSAPAQPTPPPAGAAPKTAEPSTSVTIAVTPSQAERLVAAQYKGKLKLGLRGLNDKSVVVTGGSSTSNLLGLATPGTYREPALPKARVRIRKAPQRPPSSAMARVPSELAPLVPPLPPAGAGPEPGRTVRVIRGTQVEDVNVAQ